MHAITSAAVALQMVRVCQRGEVKICSTRCALRCSPLLLKKTLKRKEASAKEIKDEQTHFGLWITEYLTDIARHQKRRRDDRELAIKHNNKIGRNVVKYMAKRSCRCHGKSGTCAWQTCAESLPTLKDVGTTLKYLYELAHKGVVYNHKELRLSSKVHAIDLEDVLVYLSKSPDYCKRNTSYGLQGKLGRVCRVPHRGSTRGSMKGHCNNLCFSCGYTIKYEVRQRKVRCNCKFKWCCQVKCDMCKQDEDVLVCHKH